MGLKLLAALFSEKELVNGNPSGVSKSKDTLRHKIIKRLDVDRMKTLKVSHIISMNQKLYLIPD